MASDTQETLYRIFAGLAGPSSGESRSGGGLTGGGIGSTVSAAVSNKGDGGGAGEIVLNVLKSGLGSVPLAAALFRLFGGGDDDEMPEPLVKYALPARREFHAAATPSGLAEVGYDQAGAPRVYERRVSAPANAGPEFGSGSNGAAPQINVNVQAMDARSFLDRSSDIAAAVREAMLNLNSINDVVTDL